MIVLDEQIHGPRIREPIAHWYPGRVLSITELRRDSTILDDAVPTLLRTLSYSTFVTINVSDFWRKIPARNSYAIVCLELPNHRAFETPDWLRHFLSLPEFKSKSARMGSVALIRPTRIEYYRSDREINTISRQH